MWHKERELWKDEDQRIQEKIHKINKENQQFLKMQEDEKKGSNKQKMIKTEKQLNKGLMAEIKAKKREILEQTLGAETASKITL